MALDELPRNRGPLHLLMLYAGTSGYSFREWVGSFYPPGTPSHRYLSHYASRLNSVEINHSFRRFPTTQLTSGWAAQTAESCRFYLKMHQSVTHVARLKGVEDSVKDFMAALEPLGPRLGVVLFQLPPNFKLDLDRLKRFLGELPFGYRFALEFRHPSWNEPTAADVLRDGGVALCAADVEIGKSPFTATASHGYLRLRKAPPYSDDEIGTARRRIQEIRGQVDTLYLYAKHDVEGLAPEAILRLTSSDR